MNPRRSLLHRSAPAAPSMLAAPAADARSASARHAPSAPPPFQTSPASPVAPGEANSPPFDEAVIGQIAAILGAARLDGLLALLDTELATGLSAIVGAAFDRDFAAAAAAAHGLRGASGSLGAAAVADAAGRGEVAIRLAAGGDPRALASALDELAQAIRRTQHALPELRSAVAGGPRPA